MALFQVSFSPGSSPRTWGTPGRGAVEHAHARFIPTHVGNAVCAARPIAGMPVHPHARGERAYGTETNTWVVGSSPRTWGTQPVGLHEGDLRRFIPTHVGNADSMAFNIRSESVHPHARGERGMTVEDAFSQGGSSPRTWGTRHPVD